jgi:hypothetical protein
MRFVPFGLRVQDLTAELARREALHQRKLRASIRHYEACKAAHDQLIMYAKLLRTEILHCESTLSNLTGSNHESAPATNDSDATALLAHFAHCRDQYRDQQRATLDGVMQVLRPYLRSPKGR